MCCCETRRGDKSPASLQLAPFGHRKRVRSLSFLRRHSVGSFTMVIPPSFRSCGWTHQEERQMHRRLQPVQGARSSSIGVEPTCQRGLCLILLHKANKTSTLATRTATASPRCGIRHIGLKDIHCLAAFSSARCQLWPSERLRMEKLLTRQPANRIRCSSPIDYSAGAPAPAPSTTKASTVGYGRHLLASAPAPAPGGKVLCCIPDSRQLYVMRRPD